MRGKLRYRHYPLLVARIIPAHAGQTCCRRRPSRSRPDHPRACGANNFEESKPLPAIGSSPRMRGKPSTRGLQGTRRRIIPAHAGQTTSGLPGSVTSSDHPRACGANYGSNSTFQSFSGSSPRMRGKRSPSCLAASRPDSPDHPRACGANSFTPAFNWPSTGSSPRMRGKLICRFCRRCRMRIIPAHAGQTTRTTSCPARYPDHPRACGANLGKIGSLFGSFGSSPRMRGKRRPRPCPRTPVRIIPAHAGQTPQSMLRPATQPDHPRACGANPVPCSFVVFVQ